jgi:hypothetical protein
LNTFLSNLSSHLGGFAVAGAGATANPPKSDDKYAQKVFNWSEVHLSEMTSYKIHTLVDCLFFGGPAFRIF